MGRRIPSKHKKRNKLKSVDPFNRKGPVVNKRRKSNAAPKREEEFDSQPISRSMKEFLELANQPDQTTERKRRRKARKDEFGLGIPRKNPENKNSQSYFRYPGETVDQLLHRITVDAKRAKEEANLKEKLEKQDQKIEKKTENVKKRNEERKEKERRKKARLAGSKTTEVPVEKESWKKRKTLKKKEKKILDAEDQIGDFDHLKDNVKFGEVALAPPSLHFKHKGAAKLTGSRKSLTAADRIWLERERERAVEAYEVVKRKRMEERESNKKK